MTIKHVSVMVNEVMNILNPKDGGIYVDGTFKQAIGTKRVVNGEEIKYSQIFMIFLHLRKFIPVINHDTTGLRDAIW